MLECNAACAVWDLDGTLLNSFKIFEANLPIVLQREGLPIPSREAMLNNFHGRLKDSIQLLCGIDGDVLDRVYIDFVESEEHLYEDPRGLYFPDAIELLRRNHKAGVRQIIVSNRHHYQHDRLGSPRALSKKAPLAGYVDAVVCGDDYDFCKPDARVLDAVETALKITRDQLIVIGDQFVDAEFAHNLGVSAVLVQRHDSTIPHLDKLHDGWERQVHIVSSLSSVSIRPV